MDNGIRSINELITLITNIKSHVMDLDQSSGYPSNGMAANVSKDTTHREIINISGIPKNVFMMQNINLMFGRTNALEYCQYMFNLPSLYTIVDKVK